MQYLPSRTIFDYFWTFLCVISSIYYVLFYFGVSNCSYFYLLKLMFSLDTGQVVLKIQKFFTK